MRFRNVGLSKFLGVLHPTYRPEDEHATRLDAAMGSFAKHFDLPEGDLLSEWKHLLRMKDRHLAANPEARTLKAHQFWPSLLRKVKAEGWDAVSLLHSGSSSRPVKHHTGTKTSIVGHSHDRCNP